jgi:putative flavoprotein involved in K+ transport
MKYFRRGGGYNLDAGSSALLTRVNWAFCNRIERFTADGALLKDRSTVPADLIVLETGYELRNMFKRTPQEGL